MHTNLILQIKQEAKDRPVAIFVNPLQAKDKELCSSMCKHEIDAHYIQKMKNTISFLFVW